MSKYYSYSKLSCFEQCQRQYYYTYILKKESGDNIYSLAGTALHNSVEAMQLGEIDNKEAEKRFLDELELAECFGYEFMSDKIKHNYVESLKHYLRHYKPIDGDVRIEIEKEFTADFKGHLVKGFIDLLIIHPDNSVDIYDYKSSSIYDKKKMIEHSKQLLIYSYAMEQEGYKVNSVQWAFAKYAKIKTKRSTKNILRCDLDENQEFEECLVSYPVTEETLQECEDWVCDIIEQIEAKGEDEENWITNCDSSFFCNTLCGHCKYCPKAKSLKNSFFNR